MLDKTERFIFKCIYNNFVKDRLLYIVKKIFKKWKFWEISTNKLMGFDFFVLDKLFSVLSKKNIIEKIDFICYFVVSRFLFEI